MHRSILGTFDVLCMNVDDMAEDMIIYQYSINVAWIFIDTKFDTNNNHNNNEYTHRNNHNSNNNVLKAIITKIIEYM